MNQRKFNTILFSCYLLISILIIYGIYGTNIVTLFADSIFHHERILSIVDALRNGTLKQWIYFKDYSYKNN